ncbi:hypothetical protein Q4Q35_11905 [Flavivirga aquimarina]|uniref:Bacterial transcription activator effector binding domain-containing protein n=1 Tax=Flavivirga aquimarina TaxID=2027862 RepID=A0ABT8WBV9_9FLAO|nr:hypothetical protein [Flavivirga aquimarina]MDO5970511.1 hypothetical protein [Flavivirga aquimarina]
MQIEKNKEIKLQNLLSCRKKVQENEIDEEFALMAKLIDQKKLNQIGGVITAVYHMDRNSGLMDMEIMIPIEHNTDDLKDYTIKPIFHLMNALHLSYEGSSTNLTDAHNMIYTYVRDNKLQPITPLYNFYSNINEDSDRKDETLKVDLLIGINPSIL